MNSNILVVILSRNITRQMYDNYSKIFNNHYELLFISENETNLYKDNIVYYDFLKLLNIKGNYQNLDNISEFSCYDAFFYYLNNKKLSYDHYWLINSDTYIDPIYGINFLKSFNEVNVDFITFGNYYSKKYINNEIEILPDQKYWEKYDKTFKSSVIRSSCNALCRISKKFTKHIDNYRKSNKNFINNSVLFPSIVKTHNLKQIVYTKPLKNILIDHTIKFYKPKNGFEAVNFFNRIKNLVHLVNTSSNIIIYPFPNWFKYFTVE